MFESMAEVIEAIELPLSFISFPVVRSNAARLLFVAPEGPTTSPVDGVVVITFPLASRATNLATVPDTVVL